MNAFLINMMLAVFWLMVGLGLLIDEALTGVQRYALRGINPGWVAIVFAAFNFYRVWSIRSYQQRVRQQIQDDQALRRNRVRHREERERDEPPNPDFMFNDSEVTKTPAPPPPPDDRIQNPGPELRN